MREEFRQSHQDAIRSGDLIEDREWEQDNHHFRVQHFLDSETLYNETYFMIDGLVVAVAGEWCEGCMIFNDQY